MNDIAEEDSEGAHDQADAGAEEHEKEQTNGQPDDVPGGDNAEPQHDKSDGDQREGEVHECEQDLLDWEDEARDADLLEQRGGVDERHERLAGGLGHERERDVAQDEVKRIVLDECEQDLLDWEDEARDADLLEQRGGVDERHERLAGGLGHERERDVAQNEVKRIVLDVGTEDEREHDAHDNHHHEGVQYGPCDAEDAAAVLALEVLGDELLEDEAVLIELGFCERLNVSGGGGGIRMKRFLSSSVFANG